MKEIPPIKSVMTAFPYWIDVAAPLAEARRMMADRRIGHLPVMERGEIVGVLTERDARKVLGAGRHAPSEKDLRVHDVCTMSAYVVGLSEPLDRVLSEMAREHHDAVLVLKEGKLAGIFTWTDACRSFGRMLRQLFPSGGDDAA